MPLDLFYDEFKITDLKSSHFVDFTPSLQVFLSYIYLDSGFIRMHYL